MAPPTGPRNPRPARNNNANSKPIGRGINKRRDGGRTKVDRDGDLVMDPSITANGAGRGNNRTNDGPSAPTGPGRRSTRSSTSARPPRPTAKATDMVKKVFSASGGGLSSRIPSSGIDSSRVGRSSRPINAPNTMTLKVQGLNNSRASQNDGGGLKELLIFLERKAVSAGKLNRTIRIKKSQLNGDFVYIIASKEDAEAILKLNGFTFVGAPINITEAPEGMPGHAESGLSATSQELKTRLIQVLSNRYDPNAKLLNLSKLGEDAELIQMGFFTGESKPQKLFQALMAICDSLFKGMQEKRDALNSISLAGNNIDDVLQIMSLADTLPELINLDLSFNQFRDLKGLRKWNHRLRNLQTLLLNDNPIEVAEPTYKSELTKWFPKLQNLSGTQVRTPEQVASIEAASKVSPIPQAGADFRDINRVGEGFITEFIQMYDADRQGLATKYYDEQSSFSLAVNNRAPHPPDMQPPSWAAYIKLSRNHVRITNPPSRYQRLFTGAGLIQAAWQKLPPTRHPDLGTQFDKYIIDCHPISGLADPTGQNVAGVDGMIMTFHGEFEDQDPDTKNTAMRSFSRTILLGPGAPGRNPIRVISDMLSLRAYNPLPALPSLVVPAPPVAQVAPAADVDAQKQQILVELCKQTGMTPEFSTMCLDVAGWNFDQALVTFNEKRGQLPQEAFASATV